MVHTKKDLAKSRLSTEQIAEAIEKIYKRHKRITSSLLREEYPAAWHALLWRVRKGEFSDIRKGIEEIRGIKCAPDTFYGHSLRKASNAKAEMRAKQLVEPSKIEFKREDLVMDINPASTVFHQKGRVSFINKEKGEVKVDFREKKEIPLLRVYILGVNLRFLSNLDKKP